MTTTLCFALFIFIPYTNCPFVFPIIINRFISFRFVQHKSQDSTPLNTYSISHSAITLLVSSNSNFMLPSFHLRCFLLISIFIYRHSLKQGLSIPKSMGTVMFVAVAGVAINKPLIPLPFCPPPLSCGGGVNLPVNILPKRAVILIAVAIVKASTCSAEPGYYPPTDSSIHLTRLTEHPCSTVASVNAYCTDEENHGKSPPFYAQMSVAISIKLCRPDSPSIII